MSVNKHWLKTGIHYSHLDYKYDIYCVKCERPFLLKRVWADGTNAHIKTNSAGGFLPNALYNLKFASCEISDGEYKFNRLLK